MAAVLAKTHNPKSLQTMLYSGVVLIVISMLFLGREQQSASFVVQAFTVLFAPAFFYVAGAAVWRYLRLVLAAPGLIATGAWLIGVGLIHLYDKRVLLPENVQPYYWLIASVISAILITQTGRRVWIWMLVPLVPLTQVNALWATMSAFGVEVRYMPALSFMLVLAWWEVAARNERWTAVYRTSAVVLTIVLLLFTMWLPLSTPESRMITWGMGALMIAVLGLRHGWVRMGPLAIALLTCATIWGLPRYWWPMAWLALAAVTVIFIERVSTKDEKSKDGKALEISRALALLLSGFAALFAQVSTFFGAPMSPVINMLVVFGAGALMITIGWRHQRLLAVHIGLWLLATAWALLYFIALPSSGMFGLWLALLAAFALLVAGVISSRSKDKYKEAHTLGDTLTRWPLADLIIGLSTIIMLWSALNITAIPAGILTVTISIVVGIWLAAGLFYRLPVLLHAALWIAPLPYALILLIVAPAIWTVPLMGVAWQVLGIVYLVLGHSLVRRRPAILAPFFIVGYALIGFGLSLAIQNNILLPLSLGLVIVASIGTSAAVILNYHPVWSWFIAGVVPAHRFPFAYQSFNHFFLLLSAWLSAIWLYLILGETGLPLARQGIFLVVFAAAWFVLGRMLSNLPGVVGWPVMGAGWLLWLIGLIDVFFSPNEAIITVIVGLAISGEALRRSRAIYWIPVFILQVFFTVLQVAWMFELPSWFLLLVVGVALGIGGIVADRSQSWAARITASMGALLVLSLWLGHHGTASLIGLIALAFVGLVVYWRWQWLLALYVGLTMLLLQAGFLSDWRVLLVFGTAHLIVGLHLVKKLRPRRYRTLQTMFIHERDWASPFLWLGTLVSVAGIVLVKWPLGRPEPEPALFIFGATIAVAIFTAKMRVRNLAYLPLALASAGLTMHIIWLSKQPFSMMGGLFSNFNTTLSVIAVILTGLCGYALQNPRHVPRSLRWWIRPLLRTSLFIGLISLALLVTLNSLYHYHYDHAMIIINGVLLTAWAWLTYTRRRQVAELLFALLVSGCLWLMVTQGLHVNNALIYSVPAGIGLLFLARIIRRPENTFLEIAGVLFLLVGASAGINLSNPLSLPTVILIAHVVCLLVYGYLAGRRIPFMIAAVVISGGVIGIAAKINLWLIPLASGLMLLTATIVLEAQREMVESWLQQWRGRWQQWT